MTEFLVAFGLVAAAPAMYLLWLARTRQLLLRRWHELNASPSNEQNAHRHAA